MWLCLPPPTVLENILVQVVTSLCKQKAAASHQKQNHNTMCVFFGVELISSE